MSHKSLQRTYFFILLTLLVGKGDGQWKKSSKEMLLRDIRIYKKITEKVKREFDDLYSEYSHEPVNDYFLEEIDYVESKIRKYFTPKLKFERPEGVHSNANHTRDDKQYNLYDQHFKTYAHNITSTNSQTDNIGQENTVNNINSRWPKFEEILMAIGKQYDWRNDRWIKVKAKMKDKEKKISPNLKHDTYHQKHNFKYKIVKLSRAKSKKNIVIAVTAVR